MTVTRLVLTGDIGDPARQREGDMDVRYRQQLALAPFHPFACLRAPAHRTVPVGTGNGRAFWANSVRELAYWHRHFSVNCNALVSITVRSCARPSVTLKKKRNAEVELFIAGG
jgi:hypothetical protein